MPSGDRTGPQVEASDAAEFASLTAALRAHLQWSRALGTTGLEPASLELVRERGTGIATPDNATPEIAAPDIATPEVGARTAPTAAAAQQRRDASAGSAQEAEALAAAGDRRVDRRRLELLQQQVETCTRCGLHQGRTQTVFARGDGSSGLCFIGEGPGADEDAQGIPFVGAAGQLLDRMIGAMGLERDSVYVCNIVKCRPPKNRKPEESEMAACLPYLQEQLEGVAPRVIVALGATAVQGLLGTTVGITRLRGQWRLYRGTIPVMPTFHPAYLLRNPRAKREVWADLQSVLQHLGRPVPAQRG